MATRASRRSRGCASRYPRWSSAASRRTFRCTRNCCSMKSSCAVARRSITSRSASPSVSRQRRTGVRFDVRQRFALSRHDRAHRRDSMSYVALHFDVSAADGDMWSDALLQAGALSVDATDPRAGTLDESPVFDERIDGERRWWPISRLTALVAADTDAEALLKHASRIAARSMPIFETTRIADQDWVRATQAQFQPIRITDDLWIVPTWCTAPVADAINIALDPGVAFGTGAHPTTRLCLAWLRSVVSRGSSVLDYGCGSGILAIAAAKLGA